MYNESLEREKFELKVVKFEENIKLEKHGIEKNKIEKLEQFESYYQIIMESACSLKYPLSLN